MKIWNNRYMSELQNGMISISFTKPSVNICPKARSTSDLGYVVQALDLKIGKFKSPDLRQRT